MIIPGEKEKIFNYTQSVNWTPKVIVKDNILIRSKVNFLERQHLAMNLTFIPYLRVEELTRSFCLYLIEEKYNGILNIVYKIFKKNLNMVHIGIAWEILFILLYQNALYHCKSRCIEVELILRGRTNIIVIL
jgi:hypothetical protein